MSRFKHVLMGSVLAVALIALPAVPAFAGQAPTPATPHTSTTTLASGGMATPDGGPICLGCW